MTYVRKLNPEFRVRHEGVQVYNDSGDTRYGRYWFDDTAARLGGTDGAYYNSGESSVNLTGTQTILQDDIGIVRSTTSGVDSGLPPGEYELIYKSFVQLDGGSSASAAYAYPHSYQISQHQISPKEATFTPILRSINQNAISHYEDAANGVFLQKGVNIQWSEWTGGNGLQYYRMYDLYWRFSTTGATNGSRSNLRIFNQTDHVHVYNWEDIKIVKLG